MEMPKVSLHPKPDCRPNKIPGQDTEITRGIEYKELYRNIQFFYTGEKEGYSFFYSGEGKSPDWENKDLDIERTVLRESRREGNWIPREVK